MGTYSYDGNKFESKDAMCSFYGIPVSVYNTRIKSGWSIRDALNIPVGEARKHRLKNKRYEYNGDRYREGEISSKLSIDKSVVKGILSIGGTVADIVEIVNGGRDIREAELLKDTMNYCKMQNIDLVVFLRYIMAGCNEEQATRLSRINSEWVTGYNLRQICNKLNLVYNKIFTGLVSGTEIKELLTSNSMYTLRLNRDIFGRVYRSKVNMCNVYRIDPKSYDSRVKYGWDPIVALITPRDIKVRLSYIDEKIKSHYKIIGTKEELTVEEMFYRFRPELLEGYQKVKGLGIWDGNPVEERRKKRRQRCR